MTTSAGMQAVEFPKVLSADAALAGNIWKYSLHDDTGRLSISDHGFSYQGETRKLAISWDDVRDVSRRNQDSPRALQAVCAALMGLFFLAGGLIRGDLVTMFFILLPALGGFAYWLREASSMSWVVVTYGPADRPENVWMTEAVRWWDSRDGSEKIFAAFQAWRPVRAHEGLG